MARRKGSLRARASSILRSPLATIHQGQIHNPSIQKRSSSSSKSPRSASLNEKQNGLERIQTASSGGYTYNSSGGNLFARDRDAQRVVRTIPPWVQVPGAEDGRKTLQSQMLLSPAGIYVAQHNSTPSTKRDSSLSIGDVHDHESDWTLRLSGATPPHRGSQWKAFATATAYPRLQYEGGEIVNEEWLRHNGPDYDLPWLAGQEEGDAQSGIPSLFRTRIKRRAFHQRFERTILRSPIVPMIIRMIVFGFSVIALGLATSIRQITSLKASPAQVTPSTDMAIIVDAVALVYLLYITYDEYSGKPLGLRRATAKMRLIFLDLFFIVFDSANLSLAFEAIRNTECREINDGACEGVGRTLFNDVMMRQKALASVLLVALIAWLLTFSISITR